MILIVKLLSIQRIYLLAKIQMENIFDEAAIIRQLIQPPKLTYGLISLGPILFEKEQKTYQRIDFHAQTKDKLRLNCSFFAQKGIKPQKIMVYLHCNNGSRVEAMQYTHRCLETGLGFLCYDSRACGLSEGKYITLGFREADDLLCVMQSLQNSILESFQCQYVLWGRSMGAVTTIKFVQRMANRVKILAVVLDSPFLNLKEVILETGKKRMGIPNFITDLAIKYIDPIIRQKIGYSIQHYNFQKSLKSIECPLILLASKNDGLVPQNHFVRIYDIHKGKKTIFYLDQVHTDFRNEETISKVFKALFKYLNTSNKKRQICGLETYRSQFSTKRKSLSSKKLSVATKQILLNRSNSAARRKNLVTLKSNKTVSKQNIKTICLSGSRQINIKQSQEVSQFALEPKRTIKIINFRNMIDKKKNLKMR